MCTTGRRSGWPDELRTWRTSTTGSSIACASRALRCHGWIRNRTQSSPSRSEPAQPVGVQCRRPSPGVDLGLDPVDAVIGKGNPFTPPEGDLRSPLGAHHVYLRKCGIPRRGSRRSSPASERSTAVKIAILSRAPQAYSTRRFRVGGGRSRAHRRVLNTMRFAIDLSHENPDLQYRGRPLSHYDAVLPRIGAVDQLLRHRRRAAVRADGRVHTEHRRTASPTLATSSAPSRSSLATTSRSRRPRSSPAATTCCPPSSGSAARRS